MLHGAEILEFVQEPKTRRLLVAAAESGAPAVTAISGMLQELAAQKTQSTRPSSSSLACASEPCSKRKGLRSPRLACA